MEADLNCKMEEENGLHAVTFCILPKIKCRHILQRASCWDLTVRLSCHTGVQDRSQSFWHRALGLGKWGSQARGICLIHSVLFT